MYIKDLQVYIVKQVRVKFDRVARGEEDHDFLILMLFKESEQKSESIFGVAEDKSLI